MNPDPHTNPETPNPAPPQHGGPANAGQALLLWLAQGFGIGRIRRAPGTFGSALGLLWFALLLASHQLWLILAGSAVGLALSVWLCGAGEKILGRRDPGSVVMDEITAIPVCFITWLLLARAQTGALPGVNYFVSHWPGTLGVFAAFRFFDIAKPWPVRQSQSLPGGWGITVDDFLAAVYVNAVTALAWRLFV